MPQRIAAVVIAVLLGGPAVELDVAPTGTPMTYLQDGRQLIVLAYGTANDTGLVALALE